MAHASIREFYDDRTRPRTVNVLERWYGLGHGRITTWLQEGRIKAIDTPHGPRFGDAEEAALIDLILSRRNWKAKKKLGEAGFPQEDMERRRDLLLLKANERREELAKAGPGAEKASAVSNKKLEKALSKDYIQFIEDHVPVRTKGGKRQPFKLWPHQKEYCRRRQLAREEGRQFRMVQLKPRQIGSSASRGACAVKDLLQYPGSRLAVIADRLAVAVHIARRYIFEPMLDVCQEFDIPLSKFSTGTDAPVFVIWPEDKEKRTEIWVLTANQEGKTGRSLDFQFLIMSEVAFFSSSSRGPGEDNLAEEVFTSVMQCVPDQWEAPQAALDVESTAWGAVGKFYELWQGAEKGEDGWEAFFIGWQDVLPFRVPGGYPRQDMLLDQIRSGDADPKSLGLDEEELGLVKAYPQIDWGRLLWRRETIRVKCNGSLAKFKQEYPSNAIEAFLTSGAPVFDTASVDWIRKELITPGHPMMFVPDPTVIGKYHVEAFSGFDPEFLVWQMPQKEMTYVIGVDVSLGVGGINGEGAEKAGNDRSVASVWCVETLEQVAEYKGFPTPEDLGDVCYRIGAWYNKAAINVERNGYGIITIDRLKELRYPSLYMFTAQLPDGSWSRPIIGTLTDKNTRTRLLTNLRQAVKNRVLKPHSEDLVREMTRFQAIGGRWDHIKSGHDDHVFAAGHALSVLLDSSPLFATDADMVNVPTDYMRVQQEMAYMGAKAWDGKVNVTSDHPRTHPILSPWG